MCPGQGGSVSSAVASMLRHPCYIKSLKAERLKKKADNSTLYQEFIRELTEMHLGRRQDEVATLCAEWLTLRGYIYRKGQDGRGC